MDNKNTFTYRKYQEGNRITGSRILLFFLGKTSRSISRRKRENYLTWGRGAGFELGVANNLEKNLGEKYKILMDFQTDKGNIDIIVVGPGGVFCIEVKSSRGDVTYENEQLFLNATPVNYLKQVYAEYRHLSGILPSTVRNQVPVIPILEITHGNIDRESIHGPLWGKIWVGGFGFSLYVIQRAKNALTPTAIEKVYNFLLSSTLIG